MSERNETYDVPSGLYYTKEHEWVRRKGTESGVTVVGITDYAAKMLHDIVYVNLPQVGTELKQKESFGQVESVKTVADVYMPLSGVIVKTNQRLASEPEVIASSPYGDGWMLEVKASNFGEEVGKLLDQNAYSKYIKDLQESEQPDLGKG